MPLQVASDRYRRMDRYLSGIGHSGARMMRQTASVQMNVDPAGDPSAGEAAPSTDPVADEEPAGPAADADPAAGNGTKENG